MGVQHLHVVAGAVLRGKGVGLAAHRVHDRGDVAGAAFFRALEDHVLDEMGHAVQVRRLEAAAVAYPNADRRRAYMVDLLRNHAHAIRQNNFLIHIFIFHRSCLFRKRPGGFPLPDSKTSIAYFIRGGNKKLPESTQSRPKYRLSIGCDRHRHAADGDGYRVRKRDDCIRHALTNRGRSRAAPKKPIKMRWNRKNHRKHYKAMKQSIIKVRLFLSSFTFT